MSDQRDVGEHYRTVQRSTLSDIWMSRGIASGDD